MNRGFLERRESAQQLPAKKEKESEFGWVGVFSSEFHQSITRPIELR
jgi:hypothetical protein